MKYTVVEELPSGKRGKKYATEYREAIEAALENEPKWVRIDGLGSKVGGTASGRVRGLQKEADKYLRTTGLSGRIEVVGRRDGPMTYPFVRKLRAEK